MGAVLAAVLLGLLWFLWSPRVAAARNFPKASPGSSRKAARKPQENSGHAPNSMCAEAAARSADARLQSRVRARCLDALAAPLVVVPVLLGASSPSPLAVVAAIFALLLRLPCLWLLL